MSMEDPTIVDIRKRISLNKFRDHLFWIIGLFSTLIGFILLFTLMIDLLIDGFPRLSWQFLTSYPSRFPEKAGILSAWVGTDRKSTRLNSSHGYISYAVF